MAVTRVADKGAVFAVSDTWACSCGEEHTFGAYAASHWDEKLTHRCTCGIVRDFRRGRVTKVIKPKERGEAKEPK